METFALTGASISLLRKRGEEVSRRRLSFLRLVAALLTSAASSRSAAAEIPLIRVEQNVRVSSGNPERLHHEVGMAASPTDPRRLLACAMIFDGRDASRHTIVYASSDAGQSWAPTLEVKLTRFVGDPDVGFAPDGSAYFSTLPLHYESDADHETLVYRSADGGRTWSEPVHLPFIDREYLAVDRTTGPHRGRVYLHGNAVADPTVDGDERVVFTLFRSDDGGQTFGPPRKLLPDGDKMSLGTGNGAVLSDGTYVAPFFELNDRKNLAHVEKDRPSGSVKVVRSEDGGDHFAKGIVVSEWTMCRGWTPGMPYLAVDATTGPFKDRLYLVWTDRRSGRCEILFSFSSDKGKAWSKAATISDDRSPAERDRGRDHMIPAVAVNRAGVVGVSWYDRRESFDNVGGWRARFAASLDGGETFTPSVRVSEALSTSHRGQALPMMAHSTGGGHRRPKARGGNIRMEIGPQWIDYLAAADTGGIAADGDGVFHPLWVDDRTGVPQLWSAAVRVEGSAFVNGAPELASLSDVTQQVTLDFDNTAYDPKTGVVTLDLTITNTSKDEISAPLELRVLELDSGSAVPEILDASNRMTGAGAVWDFTAEVPGGRLPPGASTKPKRVRLRLKELAAFKVDRLERLGSLISIEAKVLGKAGKGTGNEQAKDGPR